MTEREKKEFERIGADGKIDMTIAYANFWNWFSENEKSFWGIVKNKGNIEEDFFNKIAPKLKEVKEGIFYLTGMIDENTVDLIFTADGNTLNIGFVEELVAAAPVIDGWLFRALKPPLVTDGINISMNDCNFNTNNISFYANEYPQYPDEIDLVFVHHDLTEENRKAIENGIYIFLDNYLGELDFLTNIDVLKIAGKDEAEKELIPMDKLKSYLNWRQKEFVEKYDNVRYTVENSFSIFEAELKSGNMLIAVIDVGLLNWDSKVSHPWIAVLKFKYDGSNSNGMPQKHDYSLMDEIEDKISLELKNTDGYLYVGRETAESVREVYFACRDFREPAKVFFNVQQLYSDDIEIEYEIYKDKYWQSFRRYMKQV